MSVRKSATWVHSTMSPKGTGIFRVEGFLPLALIGSFPYQSPDIGEFALLGITLLASKTAGKPQALHLLYKQWLGTIPSDQRP